MSIQITDAQVDRPSAKMKNDFLRRDAETHFSETFLAAGFRLVISTNYEPILDIARASLAKPNMHDALPEAQFRFWVDTSCNSSSHRTRPYLRGHGHLVFAGFDARNSLLIDLRDRQVLGRLTAEVAADPSLWKTVVFPVLLASLAGAMGLPVLHCGCVAWNDSGILLAGNSGSGKSTLSLALAETGFGFVADDRTILSWKQGHLLAWDSGPYLKLRPEAAAHFPQLEGCTPADWPNAEPVLYVDPVQQFSVERVHSCEPRWLFFLERQAVPAFCAKQISSREALARLENGLSQETPSALRAQRDVMESLAERECFLLQYGGTPQGTAWALRGFIADRHESPQVRVAAPSKTIAQAPAARRDPLRRFTPTPFAADFRVMQRGVHVESNNARILDYAHRALGRYGQGEGAQPEFVWRIISDPQAQLEPPWPEMSAFSDPKRRYVNLGQRSFIALDLETREAIAFVAEGLVKDEAGFSSIVLASLFYLSASVLGLTTVSAACVANGDKGLLLFGVPRSGKTTSCYQARGQGFTFHADQACFLELADGTLQAWGDFWPAAFHEDATGLFPGLAEVARPFRHRNAAFLCIDKDPSAEKTTTTVMPVACLFLERQATESPRLISLSPREFVRKMELGIPFNDDAGSEETRRAVHCALGRLPAYRLLYGKEPSAAVRFFRSLLSIHQVVESYR